MEYILLVAVLMFIGMGISVEFNLIDAKKFF